MRSLSLISRLNHSVIRSSKVANRRLFGNACRQAMRSRVTLPDKLRVMPSIAASKPATYRPSAQFSQRLFSSATGAEREVPVPGMGDSISEGTVTQWVKAVGEYVEADEIVCVLETDKVSVDVRSPYAGKVSAQLAKLEDTVAVGSPLFKIDESGAPASPVVEETADVPAGEATFEEREVVVNVPGMGDSISEGTVAQIVKGPGDYVNADEVVLIIETDKVSVDVNAPEAGVITEMSAAVEDIVAVGDTIFKINAGAPAPTAAQSAPVKESEPEARAPAAAAPTPTPAAPQRESTPGPAAQSSPSTGPVRTDTRVQLSQMRKRTAERLKGAQNTAAMLTTFQEVDMGNLIEMRNEYKEAFEKKNGCKLGFMSAFVKASASALQEVPAVNGLIDDATNEIVYHDYVDISVAVATPKGLVVPVLRNCEEMSFAQVEKSIANLSSLAKDNKLAVEDMAGGTFTISNGGIWGSLLSTPILNSPQSAVLGMHGIKMRPMDVNGEIVPRPMMYLALTYDHRIIDGREAVTFLKSVADKIADPRRLLLDL